MKKLSAIIMLWAFLSSAVSAQSHAWKWAETAVQPNNAASAAAVNGNITDSQGNILVTGYFYADSIKFGAYTLYNTDHSGNTEDIFVAKYDPSGNVLWAASAGGDRNDGSAKVSTDNEGNAYVAGFFYSDSMLFNHTAIYPNSANDTFDDIFLAKYNAAGVFQWAKSFGGNSYDVANGVATDGAGNVYVGGDYQSDSVSFGTYKLINSSNENAFVFKCDSNGNVLWAVGSSSSGAVSGYALTADLTGNTFITGRFTGTTADFGSQEVDNTQVGTDDIYLAKYDPSGNALWAVSAGGSLNDLPEGVAADVSGNVFITGYFGSVTAYFGIQQLTNDTTDGSVDVFVAKYDSSGNLVWVRGGYGDKNDEAISAATDTSGNVYITGYFYSGEIVFGNDTLYNFGPAGGVTDIFVAQYEASGSLLSAYSVGDVSYEGGYTITTDLAENVYVGGFFRSDDLAFGNTILHNSTTTHNINPFLAKYSCVSPGTPTITQSGDTLQSSAVSGNQWYLNGNAIPGATGQNYVVTQGGTYTVEVVNGPTCNATSTGITTGINNPLQIPAISLYPNPASSLLVAQSELFATVPAIATVYDVAGRIVPVDYTLSAGSINFNVGTLAAGIYWLKFNINGKEAVAKFVKVDGE